MNRRSGKVPIKAIGLEGTKSSVTGAHRGWKKIPDLLEMELYAGKCELSCICLGLNLGPFEEQPLTLNTEAIFPAPRYVVLNES